MNELQIMEKSIFAKHAKISKNSLELTENITFKEWEHVGKILFNMGGAIHFWIGDWISFGEGHYGEKYAQALEDTDFDYQTLKNDVWICSHIEKSRRRDKLTFGHHAEVASLEPQRQDELLDKCEKENLTIKELRELIKGKHKEPELEEITCPYCKKTFKYE